MAPALPMALALVEVADMVSGSASVDEGGRAGRCQGVDLACASRAHEASRRRRRPVTREQGGSEEGQGLPGLPVRCQGASLPRAPLLPWVSALAYLAYLKAYCPGNTVIKRIILQAL